jgi:hypothetical protein
MTAETPLTLDGVQDFDWMGIQARFLVLLLLGVLMTAAGCRHDCSTTRRPTVRFSSPSCCVSPYYWDDHVKDCIQWQPLDGTDCGCFCEGECSRLFNSLDDCRSKHSHCR